MTMKKLLIALVIMPVIIIAVLLIASYSVSRWNYYYGSCGVQRINAVLPKFNQVRNKISDTSDFFDDAQSTDMIGPISEMQSVKKEVELIEAPACMNKAKALMVEGIQKYIEAFLALESQKEVIIVVGMLHNATQQMYIADDEVKAVLACAPYCPQDHYSTTP